MLHSIDMKLKPKAFSMGLRIEHLQEDINRAQYDTSSKAKLLPPADYHLVARTSDGRTSYTFCMCPGGVVVPAMSEEGTLLTNGMSFSRRDGINANSALLVPIETKDFGGSHVLAGIDLQERYERYAYNKANGYKAIVQRVGDFLQGKPTLKLGKVKPTFKPDYVLGSVEDMLPDFVISTIKDTLPILDKKLHGFADEDAIFTGVETRSSAPYQVVRTIDMLSSIDNVYMIGEGAGFAGGIVSSAVEGIKCAEILLKNYGL